MRTARRKWTLVLTGLLTIGSRGASEARAQHGRGHHGGASYGHRHSPGYGRGNNGYGRGYGGFSRPRSYGYGYGAPRGYYNGGNYNGGYY
jgi:hypothetical protein